MLLFQPHPVIFHTTIFSITSHGLFFALGAVVGSFIFYRLAQAQGLSATNVLANCGWVFIIGLAAARLGYFLIYPQEYQSLTQVLAIWQGGLVSYFGIGAGLLALYFLFRAEQPKKAFVYLDLACLSTLFSWSIGRLGNYYAADSVGVTSQYWSSFYGRVPIQLFESAATLVLGLLFWRYLQKTHPPQGKLTWQILIAYFGLRFIIDIWRDEASLAGLHLSQWTALFILGLLVIGYYGPFRSKTT